MINILLLIIIFFRENIISLRNKFYQEEIMLILGKLMLKRKH